jgi:hypothetical protein
MKKFIVSMLFAAVLAAPVLAGGDCCSKKGETAAKPAACAKESAKADAGSCSKTGGAEAQTGAAKASCCAGEQAKTEAKACQTCDTQSWLMSKPNPDCKSCQTASL